MTSAPNSRPRSLAPTLQRSERGREPLRVGGRGHPSAPFLVAAKVAHLLGPYGVTDDPQLARTRSFSLPSTPCCLLRSASSVYRCSRSTSSCVFHLPCLRGSSISSRRFSSTAASPSAPLDLALRPHQRLTRHQHHLPSSPFLFPLLSPFTLPLLAPPLLSFPLLPVPVSRPLYPVVGGEGSGNWDRLQSSITTRLTEGQGPAFPRVGSAQGADSGADQGAFAGAEPTWHSSRHPGPGCLTGAEH